MGTHSVTVIRERKAKKDPSEKTSALGGPAESKYHYEYFAYIYQQSDGYVDGVGLLLAEFICKFIHEFKDSSRWIDGSFFGIKLISSLIAESDFSIPRLLHIEPLKELIDQDYEYIYIITLDSDRPVDVKIDDKSIMLSVCKGNDYILTARPEKFLEKYQYYETQMKEMGKSFAEIDYGDDEVDKEGYLSEDKLLIEFLK